MIEARLTKEGVPFELIPTRQYLDTYNFAKDLDLNKYSVLCCSGGDGSYHEVVNGMLNREDKVKIPVAFIPNGSGNNLCRALGIMNLDDALNYLLKGECIKIDTVRVLVDLESEDNLPEGIERLKSCRHMMNNSWIGAPLKIANMATPLKKWFGGRAYDLALIWGAWKGIFR